MAFRLGLDRFHVNGEERAVAAPLRARVGDVVEIGGWALDTQTRRGPAKVVARLDDRLSFAGRTGIGRPDLAAPLGGDAVESGFSVAIPTAELRPSCHRLYFVLTTETGVELTSVGVQLQLDRNGAAVPKRQIVLAEAMKSGGRHVNSVLRGYFGITNPPWGRANDGEHLLTDEFIGPALDRAFVLGFHFSGRGVNLNAIAYYGLSLAVTWRNLGDAVVSLDEHTRFAPEGIWRNTYTFIDDRGAYAALPEQRRFQFQVRNAIPWYLGFYQSWRLARAENFMRYEWMAADPFAYFAYLIERLDGSVDAARLRAIVDAGPTEESGFNVGRVGRSMTLLSEESQTLLETCIREHPSDLGELLYELPWYAAKYGAPALVSPAPGEIYLIAGGRKRRASRHWLRTHAIDPATVASAAADDLAGYALAAPLY